MVFAAVRKFTDLLFFGWGSPTTENETAMTRTDNTCEATDNRIQGLERKLQALELDLTVKKKKLNAEREKKRKLWEKNVDLETELDSANNRVQVSEKTFHKETEKYKSALALVERERDGIQNQYKKTSDLLEARSSELAAAQFFLSKTDSNVSEAEVIQTVTDLNSLIYQTSASLAEDCMQVVCRQKPVNRQWLDHVQGLYGSFTRELECKNLEMIQMALQVGIIHTVITITQSWDYSLAPSVFDEIYSQLRTSEEQLVSGRWRSLTKANLRKIIPDPTEGLIQQIKNVLVMILECTGPPENGDEVYEYVQRKGGKKIVALATLAIKLNGIFGSEVTSSDLFLFTAHADTDFDQVYMEDYYGKRSSNLSRENNSRILAGTEVGLAKSIRTGHHGEVAHSILLKAKAVLQSAMFPIREDNAGDDGYTTDVRKQSLI